MAIFSIPPLTVLAGTQTFGPFVITDSLSSFDLTFDIAALVGMDGVVEFSADGGATWRPLVQEIGLAPSVNPQTGLPVSYHLVAHWNPPLPAGQVRVTFDNAVAFASTGGTLTVT